MNITLADASLLASFPLKAWKDFGESFVEEKAYVNTQQMIGWGDEARWLAKWIKRVEKKKGVAALAYEGEKIIGMANVVRRSFPEEKVGVFGIGVRREWRGKGIGRRLAHLVIEEAFTALGVENILLKVVKENEEAITLYKKLGFSPLGVVPRGYTWYGEQKDYLIMLLTKERWWVKGSSHS